MDDCKHLNCSLYPQDQGTNTMQEMLFSSLLLCGMSAEFLLSYYWVSYPGSPGGIRHVHQLLSCPPPCDTKASHLLPGCERKTQRRGTQGELWDFQLHKCFRYHWFPFCFMFMFCSYVRWGNWPQATERVEQKSIPSCQSSCRSMKGSVPEYTWDLRLWMLQKLMEKKFRGCQDI